jgi:hypothetical protein
MRTIALLCVRGVLLKSLQQYYIYSCYKLPKKEYNFLGTLAWGIAINQCKYLLRKGSGLES